MTSRCLRHFLAVPILVIFLYAGPVGAQELPAASQLLDRYVEVTGGKANYEKIKSRISRGTMGISGIKGELVMYQKAPNLLFLEVKLPGVGTITTGYDGKVAWENNPISGAKVIKGSKLEEMVREAAMNSDVDWRQFYKDAKTVKEVPINGKPAYQVDLVSKNGTPSSRYFDKESGLIVKMSNKAETDMGVFDVDSMISDYKKFDGVLQGTKVRQSVLGQVIETNISTVEQNVNIPMDRFALPKEVVDLLKQ
jgi:outer membrane lipoprotein-sorting protein